MKAVCKHCEIEFNYYPSQSKGIYCSNKCQGESKVIENYENGLRAWKTTRKYFTIKTEYKCSECGVKDWNGKPLTLQVDHINGDITNNEMSNLRYLCPNCHTQTETWGAANISDEGRLKLKTNLKS